MGEVSLKKVEDIVTRVKSLSKKKKGGTALYASLVAPFCI